MTGKIEDQLRSGLRDKEYAEGYAESFLNAYIATQIKVIREQRGMTQAELAAEVGTTQAGISRLENVNYSSWGIRTLIKLARAFDVRLKVSFEPFGALPSEVRSFTRKGLERVARTDDPDLQSPASSGSDSENVIDIGAFRELLGSSDSNCDTREGFFYGAHGNSQGSVSSDDRVGFLEYRREDTTSRLHSALGGAL